jgi:cytochrome c peroxidase
LAAQRVQDVGAAPPMVVGAPGGVSTIAADVVHSGSLLSPNDSGIAETYSLGGSIDSEGPFFQSLGSNGRSCSSCHVQSQGWTITPRGVQRRFERTGGTDPIFRTVDGSNSPAADVSTPSARRAAYAMLLGKGLIRVGLGIPAGADFELIAVDDPYGYASAAELSLFKRPLPSTNLAFLSSVMWDGRETFKDSNSANCLAGTSTCFASVHFDLVDQSNAATLGHAQAATPLSGAVRQAIVDFETGLFTSQVLDVQAGWLTSRGARGGALALSGEPAYFGINDVLAGDYQTHAPCNSQAMTLFDAWDVDRSAAIGASPAQRAVARGQALFNNKPIVINGVGGLNDDLGIDTLQGTCTTWHDAPNAGNHSVPMPLAIGIADAARRTPDLPLYTLRNKSTGRDRPGQRPRARARDRQVEGHWSLQGPGTARARFPSAILPQRHGSGPRGRGRLLRCTLRDRIHGAREG